MSRLGGMRWCVRTERDDVVPRAENESLCIEAVDRFGDYSFGPCPFDDPHTVSTTISVAVTA